jgi:hypothetical protein
MAMTSEQIRELYSLLHALREDLITDEQFRRLDDLIIADPLAGRIYVDYVKMCCELRRLRMAKPLGRDVNCTGPNFAAEAKPIEHNFVDSRLWQELAQSERIAPAIKIDKSPEQDADEPLRIQRPVRKVNRRVFYVSVAAAAMFLLTFCYIRFIAPPPTQTIAIVEDAVNARWADAGSSFEVGSSISNKDGLRNLQKGLVKIRFEYGAEVIVEGPAEFELNRGNEMFLHSGKLYARIPHYASGFTVNTATAKIIDLGTEFGVKVNFDGTSDLYMFKGKASLTPELSGVSSPAREITGGQALRVNPHSCEVEEIAIENKLFVRRMSSKTNVVWRGDEGLSLADIVGGGNGFGTGRPDYGIDVTTGLSAPAVTLDSYQPQISKFRPVSDNPLIDGVFIPDGGNGRVQISSQGHVFEECPDTDGSTIHLLSNNAWTGGVGMHADIVKRHRCRLDGVEYGLPGRPAIDIHSNKGITFDLDAIREQLTDLRITRLTGRLGLSETVLEYDYERFFGQKEGYPKSDFWILLDGQIAFSRKGVTVHDGAIPVQVEIGDDKRFLSVIVTDGGDSRARDWALFAEPTLVVE